MPKHHKKRSHHTKPRKHVHILLSNPLYPFGIIFIVILFVSLFAFAATYGFNIVALGSTFPFH